MTKRLNIRCYVTNEKQCHLFKIKIKNWFIRFRPFDIGRSTFVTNTFVTFPNKRLSIVTFLYGTKILIPGFQKIRVVKYIKSVYGKSLVIVVVVTPQCQREDEFSQGIIVDVIVCDGDAVGRRPKWWYFLPSNYKYDSSKVPDDHRL